LSQATLITLATAGAALLFVGGSPIFLIMGLWVFAAHLIYHFPLANIGSIMFEGLNSYSLLAAPLFILTGDLIAGGGIARRMTEFTLATLGWLRGGLGMASLAACGMFAAISGSNSATTASMGSIMYPAMVKERYDPRFAAATAAAGGTVGIIIPPSILFIIYGYIVNAPISELFLAGIVPGILMVIAMMSACYFVSSRLQFGNIVPFRMREVARRTPGVSIAIMAVIIALWGIYSGVFSPTEASAVTVAYCLFAGLFLTRELKFRHLPALVFRSGMIVGIVMPLVAISIAMQQMFAVIGVGRIIGDLLTGLGSTPTLIISMLIVFVAGTLFESVPITILLAPILAPAAAKVGIDALHFAVIFEVGAAIGFITPPFGLNLYVASSVTNIPYLTIARAVIPYLVALLAAWIVIAAVPQLSTYMPQFAGLGGAGSTMR
jgi:C4-dicarboxylate transporter DctM subunit